MKTRTKKTLGVCATILLCYFAAYFLSVRTDRITIKAASLAIPVYRPFDSGIVRAVFTPAHLLDAKYLRPARWDAQTRG